MGQGAFTAKLILSQESLFKYRIVWVKSKATNFLNARRQPLRKHEDICVFQRKGAYYAPQMHEGSPYNKGVRKNQQTGSYGAFNPVQLKSSGCRYPADVVYFPTAESEGPVWHPTQKPLSLARYLIRTYAPEQGVVLDNCFGSGTFLAAAAMEGRSSVGIEKNMNVSSPKGERIDLLEVAADRLRGIGLEDIRVIRDIKDEADPDLPWLRKNQAGRVPVLDTRCQADLTTWAT